MSLQAYPVYKSSGVEWLGDVPEGWELKPLWVLFKRVKQVGYQDEQLLSVYRDYGVVIKSSRNDNNNKPSEDLSSYQLVMPNRLVMNKMKAWQGSVAISTYQGIVSPAYYVYEAAHNENSKFLHYLMRSLHYIAGYFSLSKGIRVNQWDIDAYFHSRMPILLPSPSEQTQIANFLDHETAKIDALIAEQKRLISLLKEKRQAVISHAVTKGLDPNVTMKDSGVEWLGDVPEGWEVLKLRRKLIEHRQGYYTSESYVDDGIKLLRITDIDSKGNINIDNSPKVEFKEDIEPFLLKKGDFVFARTGGAGSFGIIKDILESLIYASYLIRFRFDKFFHINFLYYFFMSTSFQLAVKKDIHGGVNQNIHAENIKDQYIAIPSLSIQVSIANFLDQETAKLDALEQEAQTAITLLKERRSALISAAVTGKIDLRNWQAPQIEQLTTN